MTTLVTGARGFVGWHIARLLTTRVNRVRVLVRPGSQLRSLEALNVDCVYGDLRDASSLSKALEGVRQVFHVAADYRLWAKDPDEIYESNVAGTRNLLEVSRQAGVERFVYTSSCSVYGAAAEDMVDEDSPLRPQTTYAICKELVERDVAQMADDGFSPTFLRNATAYGASPRMRFDIVLNNLSGLAWTTKEIRLESDGTPWRPLVHLLDISQAVACVLDAPRERIHNQVLNVGDVSGNYQIREIAEIVAGVFPGCEVTVAGRGPDARSYRVSFAKIHEVLPEFECNWNAELGARQLHDVFSLIGPEEEDFRSRRYTRLKQIEYLLRTGQIDGSFLWK